MESNGKTITSDGSPAKYTTGKELVLGRSSSGM